MCSMTVHSCFIGQCGLKMHTVYESSLLDAVDRGKIYSVPMSTVCRMYLWFVGSTMAAVSAC